MKRKGTQFQIAYDRFAFPILVQVENTWKNTKNCRNLPAQFVEIF